MQSYIHPFKYQLLLALNNQFQQQVVQKNIGNKKSSVKKSANFRLGWKKKIFTQNIGRSCDLALAKDEPWTLDEVTGSGNSTGRLVYPTIGVHHKNLVTWENQP